MDVIRPNWSVAESIKAFTTLKNNPWPIHSKDNLDRDSNIIRFAKHYSLPGKPFLVKQIHSNNVVNLGIDNTINFEADAIVTTIKNNPIAILTADCLPVLIYSDRHVGAVHAGWKGLTSGILEKTIETIGGYVSNTKFWIGPCIRKESFLVKRDFFKSLVAIGYKEDYLYTFADKVNGEQWQFDLIELAKNKLLSLGVTVSNIFDSNVCTYKNLNLHSHRRSLGQDNGRCVSVIWRE